MSTEHARGWTPSFSGFSIVMAALFSLFSGTVVSIVYLTADGLDLGAGATQIITPKMAAVGVVVIIAESLAIIGLYLGWGRLPDWLKRGVTYAIYATIFGVFAIGIYSAYSLLQAIAIYGIITALAVAFNLLDRYNLYYLAHNSVTWLLGVTIASIAALLLQPIAAGVLLALLVVWDRIAVSHSGLMSNLVEWSSSAGIPNYLVIPSSIRVSMDDVREYCKAPNEIEKPDDVLGIIGLGDFAIPALLPASIVAASGDVTPAAVAAIIGIGTAGLYLVDSLERAGEALPALVWLNVGALSGYIIGSITGVVL